MLLPEPDGPSRLTNSPGLTTRLILVSSARASRRQQHVLPQAARFQAHAATAVEGVDKVADQGEQVGANADALAVRHEDGFAEALAINEDAVDAAQVGELQTFRQTFEQGVVADTDGCWRQTSQSGAQADDELGSAAEQRLQGDGDGRGPPGPRPAASASPSNRRAGSNRPAAERPAQRLAALATELVAFGVLGRTLRTCLHRRRSGWGGETSPILRQREGPTKDLQTNRGKQGVNREGSGRHRPAVLPSRGCDRKGPAGHAGPPFFRDFRPQTAGAVIPDACTFPARPSAISPPPW